MQKLRRKFRLWVLQHRIYALQASVQSRMDILVPFDNLMTSIADLRAAPQLTKKQTLLLRYYEDQVAHNRQLHKRYAQNALRRLLSIQCEYAKLQAAT